MYSQVSQNSPKASSGTVASRYSRTNSPPAGATSDPFGGLAYFAYENDEQRYGANDFKVVIGGEAHYVNAAGDFDKIVRIGIEYTLSRLNFVGGDPAKMRAFDAWKIQFDQVGAGYATGDSLGTLMGNLRIASDYKLYEENTSLINALISASPDSPYAVGWIATLVQWDEMNAAAFDKMNTLASELFAKGDRAGGIWAENRALEFDPDNVAVWRTLALAHSAGGDWRSEAYAWTRSVEINPNDVSAWQSLASAHDRLNDVRNAAYARTRLVQMTPADKANWISLGDTYARLGTTDAGTTEELTDLKAAAYAYSRALALDPLMTAVWIKLGDTNLHQADLSSGQDQIAPLEQAGYAYLRAAEVDPNSAAAEWSLNATNTRLAPLLVGSSTAAIATPSQIMSHLATFQLSNGAIVVNEAPAAYDDAGKPYYMADVYFSGTALYWALGTPPADGVDLMRVTEDWLRWCFDNVDGDGKFGRYFYYADGSTAAATVPPDAEDSASAMVLAVLAKFVELKGSTDFLTASGMRSKVELVADVMVELQQLNDLTWASTDYPFFLTEDVAEVFAGFTAAAYLMDNVFNDSSKAATYRDAGSRIQSAILNLLYDTTGNGLFDWALDTPSDLARSWYPDAISQVWPILFGVIDPDSSMARDLVRKISEQWDSETDPQRNWVDRLDATSVALAALMTGDATHARAALLTLAQTPYPKNGYPLYVTTVADIGMVLAMQRLLGD